jgi:hypothetical protein
MRPVDNAPRLELTLLTRAYCHLCDEMRDALRPIVSGTGARVTEIDVDSDAALEARFGDLVPVLLHGSVDGVELCHYRLDAARVTDALARSKVLVASQPGFR